MEIGTDNDHQTACKHDKCYYIIIAINCKIKSPCFNELSEGQFNFIYAKLHTLNIVDFLTHKLSIYIVPATETNLR